MIARERIAPSSPAVREEAAPASRARTWTPLGAVLALLPVFALAELLLMRTFYRVGIFIPKRGPFREVYRVLTAVGSFALNLSSVLVVFAIVLVALQGIRGNGRTAGIALIGFLAVAGLVRLAGVQVLGPTARLAFGLAVLSLAVPFVRSEARPLHRAMVGGVAACFLLSSYAGVATDGARFAGSELPWGVGAQLLAESLVVATSLLAAAAWVDADGFRPGPVLIAAPLAATLFVAWQANGAITGILVLWTAGFRLALPIGVYVLALWAVLSAAIGWMPRHGWRSTGLVLLLVAGMLLGDTYLQALGLVALVLLTDGAAVGGLPEVRGAEPRADVSA